MRLYDWLADSPPPAKESASDATSPMTGAGTRHAAPLQGQGSATFNEAASPWSEEAAAKREEKAARLQMAAEQRQKREALKAEFKAAETEAEWAKAAEAKAAAAAAEEAAAAAAKEAACRALREKEAAEEAAEEARRERVVVEMAKRGWTNETEALRANAAEAKRAAAVAARRADDVKKTFAAGGWRIGDRVIAQPNNQSAGRVSNQGAEILRGDVGTVIGPSRGKKAPPGFIVVEFDGKGRIDMDGTAHLSTEAGLLWCTACHRRLPKGGFSASQLDNGRKGGERC